MSFRVDGSNGISRRREVELKKPEPPKPPVVPVNNNRVAENNLYGALRKTGIELKAVAMHFAPQMPRPADGGADPVTPPAPQPYQAVQQIKQIPVPDAKNAAALDAYIKQTQTIAQTALAGAQPPKREDFKGLPPQLANMEYPDALNYYNSSVSELKPYAEGISYARYDQTVDYMYSQMTGNLNTPEFKFIKDNLDLVANPPLFSSPNASLGYLTAAMTKFAIQVKSNGPWDHKPILEDKLGLNVSSKSGQPVDRNFPVRGDLQHEVDYDIWSNIHYGYVGRAAGFDQGTLQTAAGLEIPGLTGGNDPVDVATVQIGIDLWNKYGANMTKSQFDNEVRARIPQIIAAQQTPEYIEKNGNFHHVSNINEGNRR